MAEQDDANGGEATNNPNVWHNGRVRLELVNPRDAEPYGHTAETPESLIAIVRVSVEEEGISVNGELYIYCTTDRQWKSVLHVDGAVSDVPDGMRESIAVPGELLLAPIRAAVIEVTGLFEQERHKRDGAHDAFQAVRRAWNALRQADQSQT